MDKPEHDPRTAAVKYDPEHCWTIRELAQEGLFPESWCARIGVTLKTMYNWANTYPEFEEAFSISWHILHAYWSEEAKKAETGFGKRPPSVLLEILRKRFPSTYGQNPRNTHDHFEARNAVDQAGADGTPSDLGQLSDDDIAARIAALEERLDTE